MNKAVNQTLPLVDGSVPRVFDHWFYGAMGIHPRHLVIWYIFEKDADLSAARAGGLTDRLDRLTRQQLRACGYPGAALEEIMVSFCSDEDVQRTTGGNYWHYFK